MALDSEIHNNAQRFVLLATTTITTASAANVTTPVTKLAGMAYLLVQAVLVYGSGGTTVKVWVQTSLDGVKWADIINFPFTTASSTQLGVASLYSSALTAPVVTTDGTSADNTVTNGVLGNQVRLKYTTTGTYGGSTTLTVMGIGKS